MIEKMSDLPAPILGLRGSGEITDADYSTVVIPEIESALAEHDKVRLLYQLTEEFSGFTAGALWDETKLGVNHLRDFEKIAIVADAGWIQQMAKMLGVFMPCPVKVFANSGLVDAVDWLGE
jgi:hypothetical protein